MPFNRCNNRLTVRVCIYHCEKFNSLLSLRAYSSLSNVNECLGGLPMSPTGLAKQIAGRESPQDWSLRMGIDVRSYTLWHVNLKTASIETI